MLTVTPGATTLGRRDVSRLRLRMARASAPKSSKPLRRPTSSRVKSRTCRSTDTDSLSSARQPSWCTRRRHRFLWDRVHPLAGRIDCHRHGKRRSACSRVDAQGKGTPVLRCGGTSKFMRWPQPRMAGCTWRRPPTARSTKSTGTARRARFSIRRRNTSGARRRRQGSVYAGTGDKGVVYKITPDGRARRSTRQERRMRPR